MRQVFLAAFAAAAVSFGGGQTQADTVEVKKVHLCCGQCVKAMGGILEKVEGVSGAKCDQKAGTVTFTAKDEKAAAAGVKAMLDGGFFGTATRDGKEMKVEAASPKAGEKADVVTIKDVHACCKQCTNTISALVKDTKASFDGKGAQKTIKIEGKGLDKAEILETLRKAGFNGTVEK